MNLITNETQPILHCLHGPRAILWEGLQPRQWFEPPLSGLKPLPQNPPARPIPSQWAGNPG